MFSFQGDSEFDAASWIIAIETAIQIGLGDRAVRNINQGSQIRQIWRNLRQNCSDDSTEATEGVTSTSEIFGNKQGATSTQEIFGNKHSFILLSLSKSSFIYLFATQW